MFILFFFFFAACLSITCRRQSQEEIKIAPGELRHVTFDIFDMFDRLTRAGGAAAAPVSRVKPRSEWQ